MFPLSRFFLKLYLGYASFLFVIIAVLSFFFLQYAEEKVVQHAEEKLRSQALTFREMLQELPLGQKGAGLEAENWPNYQRIIQQTKMSFELFDKHGGVVLSSAQGFGQKKKVSPLPVSELEAVRTYGVHTSIASDLSSEAFFYHTLRIQKNEEAIQFLRLGLPYKELEQEYLSSRNSFLALSVIVAGITLLGGFLFMSYIARPLKKMGESAKAIADNKDYDQMLEVGAKDFPLITNSFNTVVGRIREGIDTIHQERNELLSILSSMVEGVIAVNANQEVVHINIAASEILEKKPSECINKKFEEIWDDPKAREVVSRVLDGNKRVQEEKFIIWKKIERIIEIHGAPLIGRQAQAAGVVLVLYDITELRRLERVRQDFVANASHELRTPLTAIQGFIETLLDDEKMPDEIRNRFFGKIANQTKRLTAIVDDVLVLSRIESKKDFRTKELIHVPNLVKNSVQNFQDRLGEYFKLEVDITEEPAYVFGEEEAFLQIIGNLLENAMKYSPGGGTIWVRVFSPGSKVWIEVEDTGIGIKEEELERIFERFYRADKAHSQEIKGTGLGLSIVKNQTLRLGGKVWVESKIKKGSIFRLEFPLASGFEL